MLLSQYEFLYSSVVIKLVTQVSLMIRMSDDQVGCEWVSVSYPGCPGQKPLNGCGCVCHSGVLGVHTVSGNACLKNISTPTL